MQMMMGAWTAQTIAAVRRLDVPDLLHRSPCGACSHTPISPALARSSTSAAAVFVDVPSGDTACSGTKLLDMLMMVSLPGREPAEAEWRGLYHAAGLTVRSITPVNPRNGQSIVEGG